jgi:hypothetical protein
MPILMTAEVRGQTPEGYDGVLAVVAEAARRSPGFVMHTSFPMEGGWRVMEVWQSKADSDRFFAEKVVPYLPPGIHPKRMTQELHSLVLP